MACRPLTNLVKKLRLLGAVCAFLISTSVQAVVYDISGSFEQLAPDGSHTWGGWADGVSGTYDDETGSISIFLDDLWGFYNIPIVGEVITAPGSYSWEACLPDGSIKCTAPAPITADISTGQWGMHGLYEWTTTPNIDLVNVWDMSVDVDGVITLSVVDSDGDGVLGVAEVDGPFIDNLGDGFSIVLDMTLTPVPIPAAVWLFSTGFLGLIGVARRKKS
jgi:hypothetical protein